MGEPYSPAPGVTLDPYGASRGTLTIGDVRWPAVEVSSYFTSMTLAGGWMAQIPFENGAVVLIVAHPDHVYDHGGPLDGHTEPAVFTASLHHQFGVSPADRFAQEANDRLPIAGMADGMLDLHPGLDTWQLHNDPEPEWLNWWLWRVGGLSAPEQRRASA